MKEYLSENGLIEGIKAEAYYSDGILKECRLNNFNKLRTDIGVLIPKYESYETRSKFRNSLELYKSGKLKNVYLENRQEIDSPIGKLNAEMITFYEDGSVHRIFPLYGQISGYWTEEEEYSLAETMHLELNNLKIDAKITCLCFYPTGNLKSITLWRNENVIIDTQYGRISVHLGISFYENGNIKSLEPCYPVKINTPIGECYAYDNKPIGIHGDCNSLYFNVNGSIHSFVTSINGVEIRGEDLDMKIAPQLLPSMIDLEVLEISPIKIFFEDNKVIITDSYNKTFIFNKEKYSFSYFKVHYENSPSCSGICENCSKCK